MPRFEELFRQVTGASMPQIEEPTAYEQLQYDQLQNMPRTEIQGTRAAPIPKSRIEIKMTPAPGMPGGRTWSIRQIMEKK